MSTTNPKTRPRMWDIKLLGVLMIIFGVAEVHTGFSHDFFGVTTELGSASTSLGAVLGFLYAVAGCLCFIRKRWSMWAAVGILAVVVGGRVAMVELGYFPLTTTKQTFSMMSGTAIAAIFALYIWFRRGSCG